MKKFKFKKSKGITFVEIILVLSIFSLLTLAVYNLASNVTASTNASNEADKLNLVIEKIERAISTNGTFEEINNDVFNEISEHHASAFNFLGVTTEVNRLHINYANVDGRACTKFSEKMLNKNMNVEMSINGNNLIAFSDIVAISEACNLASNAVSVILNNNSLSTTASISTVTPLPSAPAINRVPAIASFPRTSNSLPTYVGGTSSSVSRTGTGVNYN